MKERKTEFIIVRVGKSVKDKLLKQASESGVKLSKFIRDLIDKG